MSKAVCYFGSYDSNYSRNRIIKKGLKANGFKVYECQAQGLVFSRYYKLFKYFLQNRKEFNSIIIGFPGHYDVPLAFLLGKIYKKKVFFDIFTSTYETYVLDRKVVRKKSFRSGFFYLLDWLGLQITDYVIVDTIVHGKFYEQMYNFNPGKLIVIYVGSDTDYFRPKKVKEITDVLFYGSYQPLQGVDVIIKAAVNLPKIKFKMVGEGQTRWSAEDLAKNLKLKNVEFANWIPLKKLAEEIAKAKITLGIFGTTQKTNVVIPNKVYDALASKKVIITALTKAAKEILLNGKDSILISPNDPDKLAKNIRDILKNNNRRYQIAEEGHKLFRTKLAPEIIVKNLLSVINEE